MSDRIYLCSCGKEYTTSEGLSHHLKTTGHPRESCLVRIISTGEVVPIRGRGRARKQPLTEKSAKAKPLLLTRQELAMAFVTVGMAAMAWLTAWILEKPGGESPNRKSELESPNGKS